jgi:sulfide:quinone oxidoreductase
MAVSAESVTPKSPAAPDLRTFRTLIVGGGTAGITVAARLRAAGEREIAIVEPSTKHYYQPLWTLVGGGIVDKTVSERDEAHYIPEGVTWIRDAVTELHPESNAVALASGGKVAYEYLVVAPGIQVDWDRVEGLTETLGRNGVSSNYRYDLAPLTWKFIREFRGGTALFTFPAGPIKCAGAPQKIMYLAADYWRKRKIPAKIVYASAAPAIFGVKAYQEPLNRVIARYGIETKFNRNLIAVDGDARRAVFAVVGGEAGETETISFDLMHVVPPQSAPNFVKNSPLAETDGPQKGYVKVDKGTLRSPLFPNVFALGDAGSTPNSKTGAAIRKQAPVLVDHLLGAMRGTSGTRVYDGYASCPLVTGYGKLILAEFDYEGNPTPSIPLIDTTKERWSMYMLKRHGLPWMYWNLMLRGRA